MVDVFSTECAGVILMIDHNLWMNMIGVPFQEKGRSLAGWDCWGAVAYGLRHGFGIEVPSYTEDYTTTKEGDEISALIERESIGWIDVPLAEARTGDVIIMRILGQPWHCGLVIDPPYFIHADSTVSRRTGLPRGTVRDRWDSLLWEKRIVGVHRHPSLMEMACRT